MELVSVKRPDVGTLGRAIALKANHFALTVPTSGHFFHYHIDMKMMGRPRLEAGGGDAETSCSTACRACPCASLRPNHRPSSSSRKRWSQRR